MEETIESVEPGHATPSKLTVLEGTHIRLQPVDPIGDCSELFAQSHGSDKEHIWKYLFGGPYKDEEEFREYLQGLKDNPDGTVQPIRMTTGRRWFHSRR